MSYEVATEDFLIGGAAGCDLRIPLPNVPPVVCQIKSKRDSLTVRRVSSGLEVLLNSKPLPPNIATPLSHSDRLSVAGIEIEARTRSADAQGLVSPRFVPLDPHAEARPPKPEPAPVPGPDSLEAREAQLAHRERELEARTSDLEADRVLWYRRRQELEQELQLHPPPPAEANAELQAQRKEFERERQQLADDLIRLERRRAEADERDRKLDSRTLELDARLEQLTREAAEWEDTLSLAASEQDRLHAESDALDRQRLELDSQSARLAERSAQLEAQQNVIAVLRAKLDRTREEVEREAKELAEARVREEESQAALRQRIREAEQLRAELSTVQEGAVVEKQRLEERDSLLTAGLEEIHRQREELAATESRLRALETELDSRSTEFAEQTGSLKGKLSQALDLQARLESDRVAVREREAALAGAEEARQLLQEQLRKRAEELASRNRALEEQARLLAAERARLDESATAGDAARQAAEQALEARQQEMDARALAADKHSAALARREEALAQQVARLKEVGSALAAERKGQFEARASWVAEREAAEEGLRRAREDLETFRAQAAAEVASFQARAPELDEQTTAAQDRLQSAKEMLRGHLAELHDFARKGREELETLRSQVQAEAQRVSEQSAALDRSRSEHRLAVAEFRQQLVDWQGKVAEIKQALSRGETRLDARQAEVVETARQAEATSLQIAEQVELLRRERSEVVQKRTEMERHLADMREWYRKKLKELTKTSAERGTGNAGQDLSQPRLAQLDGDDGAKELDPGDKQLGQLLASLDLVDEETLKTLWAESGRQRRSLRQVLLASGAITLYQLALIEAGNVDGLMLGRFRVIDRLRVTPREAVYRVLDPQQVDARCSGVFQLRHLSEAEMQDAVHPDEFRQRFASARDAAHPNLAGVVELTEINGRPAALLEWLMGLPSAEWPAHAAHPGCWVRLMTMAAEGLHAAHQAGLFHGRITSDSFLLPPSGQLKIMGLGEPPWLSGGPLSPVEPSAAADFRALGQVAFGWSQLALKKRSRPGKAFPAELIGIVRRLEADAEPPMADTVPADRPYESAADLLDDLRRVARETPFSDDSWEKLLRHVSEHGPESPPMLRQSA